MIGLHQSNPVCGRQLLSPGISILRCHSREGGNPEAAPAAVRVVFPGTGRSLLDSRLRGNDEEKKGITREKTNRVHRPDCFFADSSQ